MSYDVDNLAKAILDNMQRVGVIKDDRFVVGVTCLKYTGSSDTTTIRIYKAKGYKDGT
jgi:Holliday junction resolvase RusA-like endonuclease